ncbi:hypothetical protein JW859_08025 [bacterium]|nr:hypothetical protein [bacterium]
MKSLKIFLVTIPLIVLGALIAGLLPARATDDRAVDEVEAIRAHLEGIIAELSYTTDLDRTEIADLRAELREISRDLDALNDWLGRDAPQPGTDRPGGWTEYPHVDIAPDPANARFTGWQSEARVNLEWGDYGEIVVSVIKNGYKCKTRLYRAYTGGVNASLESLNNGDIIVSVADDFGSHEFRIENGGLGPVFVRGRDDAANPSRSTPVYGGAPAGEDWFIPYRDLVDAGQLGESAAMEWLIGQYLADAYEHPELRKLCYRLAELDGQEYFDSLGWFMYESAGRIREMEIPDPRLNPAGFVHMVNKAQRQVTDELYFEFDLY